MVMLSSAQRLQITALIILEEGNHAQRQKLHLYYLEVSRLRHCSSKGRFGSEPLYLPGMQSLFVHAFARTNRIASRRRHVS
jgi:hypothetical protein